MLKIKHLIAALLLALPLGATAQTTYQHSIPAGNGVLIAPTVTGGAPSVVPVGAAGGLATLDSGGHVPTAQLAPVPNNLIAVIGDSRAEQNQYFGMSAWGFLDWANYLDGQKYQLIYNGAISGDTTRQYLSSTAGTAVFGADFGQGLQGALNSHARYVVIYGEENDPGTLTGDQVWSCNVSGGEQPCPGILEASQQIIANGQIPVIPLEAAGTDTPAPKSTQVVRYNQLAREFCQTGQAICVNFPAALWDADATTATTINLRANTTQDNLHPNELGGYYLGKVFDAALTRYVPPLDQSSYGLVDNGIPNANFATQSGGTISGGATLSSGTLPSGWSITAPAGVSFASSYVADPSGSGYDWQLAITNTAGANPAIAINGGSTINSIAGGYYQSGATISVAAGATSFVGTSLSTTSWNGRGWGVYVSDFVASAAIADYGPPGAYTATLVTPCDMHTSTGYVANTAQCGPYVLASGGPWKVNQLFNPSFTANGSATITIAQPWMRQR